MDSFTDDDTFKLTGHNRELFLRNWYEELP